MPNITVYVSKENWKQLREEQNKGGLVNELLALHYKGNQVEIKKESIYKTFKCCNLSPNCTHWYEQEDGTFMNRVTGEVR